MVLAGQWACVDSDQIRVQGYLTAGSFHSRVKTLLFYSSHVLPTVRNLP
eukprot:COSAG01_NODE_59890_length_297_cov_1.722222_1_plen_48_part_01